MTGMDDTLLTQCMTDEGKFFNSKKLQQLYLL